MAFNDLRARNYIKFVLTSYWEYVVLKNNNASAMSSFIEDSKSDLMIFEQENLHTGLCWWQHSDDSGCSLKWFRIHRQNLLNSLF